MEHLQYLRDMGQFVAQGTQRPNRYALVAELGAEVKPAIGAPAMTPQRCYNNAITMACDGHDYVEGYVFVHGVPIAHAWNRRGVLHVDYTITDQRDHFYVGVVVPKEIVFKVASTKRFEIGEGVLGTILMSPPARRDQMIRKITKEIER